MSSDDQEAMMFRKSEGGSATIVARQKHEGLYHLKADTGIYRSIWDYVADVQPDSGSEMFRATFTELFEGFDGRQPDIGDQARVTFNKKKEVELDREALLKEGKATADAASASFEATATAPPGTPTDSSESVHAAAQEMAASLPGQSPDFSQTMAAIAAARAAGDLDEVDRLKKEFAARRAAEP
jgi:hypothetical protein